MILIVDNHDSFVFNVARYFRELGQDVEVVRNDAIGCDAIAGEAPDAIVISPGPCTPDAAGVSMAAIRRFSGEIPILGVCLGHQCIGQAFGGVVARAKEPMHGRASDIRHRGGGLFAGIESPVRVGAITL